MSELNLKIFQGDGNIHQNRLAMEWVSAFTAYVTEFVGMNSTIRFGAYQFGSATFFAMDIWSLDKKKSLCITIGMSKNEVFLPREFDWQMDLSLPGIIDVFKFLSVIMAAIDGQLIVTTEL